MKSIAKNLSTLPEFGTALGNLVARDLKVKYQTKALGFLWSLVHPAILIAIWYVVFNRVLRIDVPHYWAFLIAGIIPFQFIQSTITDASLSIRRNANIMRKVYVPAEVFVIAAVTVKLVEFLLQLLVAIALLAVLHRGDAQHFSLLHTLVVLPGAIVLMYLFVLGVSLPLAAFSVIYRDLDHLVSLFLLVLFYFTPVFWALSLVHDKPWAKWFALNPALDLIELFRGPLYNGSWPANSALGPHPLLTWLVPIAFSLVSVVGGYAIFNRARPVLAEVV